MKEAATTKSRRNVNIWHAFNLTMLDKCHGFVNENTRINSERLAAHFFHDYRSYQTNLNTVNYYHSTKF